MAGRPDSYPNPVREYVLEQVCDQGRAIKPIVEALNRGEVKGFPVVPVGYSTAQRWVAHEVQLRDRAIPLEDKSLDAFVTRLWAVAGGELRKVERDARTKKPLDIKRLNELEAFAARCRRHIKRGEDAKPSATPGSPDPETAQGLAERLAAQAQPSDPNPTSPVQPVATREESPEDGGEGDSGPVLGEAQAMQPQVA